jgi:carbonic anhydrase/acetyltransferase-like protein (isoleucine patch superfamily)
MLKSFEGKSPKIAPSAYIAETACIIGDVEIGECSSVWPGAVIRGDFGKITIGKYTAVEDNCVIHSGSPFSDKKDVTIGDEVNIGHGAVLNCRKIGNNVTIGMNATLLHDAEIGNKCIIGACCLVNRGMQVPDNSLVIGVPGKIKGPVSPESSYWIQNAAVEYADMAGRHRKSEKNLNNLRPRRL